ncbi:hypothetical protein EDD16DRAFT_1063391 [Pisolithus croceorrhizus]|nr:hypothetical protein F5141DRAFT_450067 [Pisolithus sp. B1]KAI6106601.1 hypothetical protein EV401DRAFT_509270 [Pisolithus croceorrhizus]KAI6115473.1 hypothetical protein EDD16DRAFT_1063391 [Pisolithus croceorrhizus]KAI6141556.1 hypothetical protein EDD17DRAFT_1665554 [Pisolithus thermaeus]
MWSVWASLCSIWFYRSLCDHRDICSELGMPNLILPEQKDSAYVVLYQTLRDSSSQVLPQTYIRFYSDFTSSFSPVVLNLSTQTSRHCIVTSTNTNMIGQVRQWGTFSKGRVRWAPSLPNGILSRSRLKANGRDLMTLRHNRGYQFPMYRGLHQNKRASGIPHARASALSIPP